MSTIVRHIALALFLFTFIHGVHAQYSGPESVEYDPDGNRYFVSNTGSNLIRVQDQAGAVTTFVNVGASPYGLELMGDTLFACVGGSIRGYAIADGVQVFNLALGATFLNGITTDGTYLYATDFSGGKIHKVNVSQNTSSVLVASTGGSPNGIVWDPTGERLVVVFWGSGAAIKSYDRDSGAATTLVANTGVGNIDGITIDCFGNFLVASWSPARITRFEPTFTSTGVNTGITGLSNPADIDFDPVNNVVCIPNSSANNVLLAEVSCSSGVIEHRPYATTTIPNPTTGLVGFNPPFDRTEPFMVLDVRGLLQASGSLRVNAMLDLGDLPAGVYTILFTRLAQQVRVVKE